MACNIKKLSGTKNTWIIRYDTINPVTEKRKQNKRHFIGSKREAEVHLTQLQNQINRSEYIDIDISLKQYLEKWIEVHCRPNLQYKTNISYTGIITKYIIPNLGRIKLTEIKPAHIQDYYLKMGQPVISGGAGLSPTSVLYHHRILGEALKHAVNQGYMFSNPVSRVQSPRKNRPEMTTLSVEQAKDVLTRYRDNRIFVPVYMAIMTGMRQGEIMALRWQNVNLVEGYLSVTHSLQKQGGTLKLKEPKTTKSRRRIPLPPQAVELLQQLHNAQELNKDDMGQAYDPGGFVCCWEDGKPMDPEWVGKKWRRLVESDPLIPNHVRFHDLRHTHASILLSQGLNLKIVQERLGHESIATTGDIYSHVTPGMQQQAVSILETLFITADINVQQVCVANVSEIEITP